MTERDQFELACAPIEFIIRRCCKVFKVARQDMRNDCRLPNITRARFAAYWLARSLLPLRTYPELAKAFDRDHTTVMHGVTRCAEIMFEEPIYRINILALRRWIEGELERAREIRNRALGEMSETPCTIKMIRAKEMGSQTGEGVVQLPNTSGGCRG